MNTYAFCLEKVCELSETLNESSTLRGGEFHTYHQPTLRIDYNGAELHCYYDDERKGYVVIGPGIDIKLIQSDSADDIRRVIENTLCSERRSG